MTTLKEGHRHRRAHERGPYCLQGMCQCPGCSNAFSYWIEECSCGAERIICSGMGTASLRTHIANGFSRWEEKEIA